MAEQKCGIQCCPLFEKCTLKDNKTHKYCTRYRAYQRRFDPEMQPIVRVFFPTFVAKNPWLFFPKRYALKECA